MADFNWDDLSPVPVKGMGGSTAPGIGNVDDLVAARIHRQVTPAPVGPSWDDLSDKPPPVKQVGPDTSNGQHLSAYRAPWWERTAEHVGDAFEHSPFGGLLRTLRQNMPSTEDYAGGGDNSQNAQIARASDRVAQDERDRREQYAGGAVDDPWRRPDGTTLGNFGRGVAAVAGDLVGGMAGDPTNLIAPGKNIATKMVGQAGIGGLSDLGVQSLEEHQGVRDHIDPAEVGITAAMGAGQVGLFEAIPMVRNWWKSRGVDTGHVPDEQLLQGSLDGSIGGPDAAADFGQFMQATAAMRNQNPVMDATINRGAADAYGAMQAQRATAAQPPLNLGDAVAAGIGSKRIEKAIDQFQSAGAPPQPRVVPDDVTMIAAPEGTVRSDDPGADDPGAQVAVERMRAANQAVLDQAGKQAPVDPTLAHILDADLKTQKKVEVLWDQLHKEPPAGTSPFQASTVAEAGAPRAVPEPKAELPYRMSAPDGSTIDGLYSGISRPVEGRNVFGAPREPRTTNGAAEDVSAKISPTLGERERGVPADLEAPMGAGGSDRLFKSGAHGDDFWEARAGDMHHEAFAKAQADLEAEWARRAEARAQREANRGADQRFHDERVRGEDETRGDPSNLYRDKYDQKPVKSPTNPDAWHMTKEGFVAGAKDRPVAFRNPKEAAKWAAANRMGGDFELASWKTNSGRAVLRRREGSTYGERPAPSPAEPTAASPEQRLLAGPREETPDLAERAEQADSARQGGDVASGNAAGASERPRPTDALTFIARHGGIASETNHRLRKGGREMPQFAPGGGHLFRKGGKSIDEVGELLHEAGYFTGERPTEAEVLDLLHKSEFERQYRPEDVETVRAHEASEENHRWEENARSEIADVAAEHPEHDLSDRDTNRVLELMASGKSAHEAYREHIEEEISKHLDAMSREAGDEGYDFHDDPVGQDARGGAEGNERPARVEGDQGERGQAAADAGHDGQQDAFGTRPGDERASLERKAEGRSRSDAPQKAPGSDGGLFDGGRDRPLFENDAIDRHDRFDGKTPLHESVKSGPLADALDAVARTSTDEHYRNLANILRDLSKHIDLRIVRRDDLNDRSIPHNIANTYGTLAHKDGEARVFLNDFDRYSSGATEETLLHEAIHAVIATRVLGGRLRGLRLDGNLPEGGFSIEARRLWAIAQQSRKAYIAQRPDLSMGLGHVLSIAHDNIDEFLTYAMTDKRFADWLDSIPATGETVVSKPITLWQKLVNLARRVVGLDPKYAAEFSSLLKPNGTLRDAADDTASGIFGKLAQREPKEPTGRLDRVLLEQSARDPVNPKEPGPSGWKRVAGLVFEGDMLDHEGPAIVGAVKSVYGSPKTAIGKVADRMRAFGEVAAYSADSAARSLAARFEAPTIAKLADLFHAEAGKTDKAVDRTYTEAVSKATNGYLSQLHGALKPFLRDDGAMGRIRDLLATPDKAVRATAEERAAAVKVRDMLKDLLEYRLNAGEDIGSVRDGYFPRVTRFDKVAAQPEAFRRAAMKVYAEIGHDDPAAAAEALLTNAINGSMNISDAPTFGGGGKPSSAKAREFGKSADEHLRAFYETNPMRALSDYIGSATRRAEEARRFGIVGRAGSPERLEWMRTNGDRNQWDVMKRQIQAELRAKGSDARGVMERIEAIRATNLGHRAPGEIKAGATVSVIHAWNQLGTLAQATFASLPEMAMGFVRGGPRHGFTHLSTTFSEFARNVRKAPASDARRYAEAAGAVGSDTALDLMRARADDPFQHVATQKLLHQFYRKTGLEQWTDAGRTAAVKTGQRFVDVLAHDLKSENARTRNRASGYLRELGVADPEAFGAFVRKGAPSIEDMKADKGMAREYATSLLRFANQSVLMPTRSVKPTWASHPLGSLVFALQSYNFAFKKNVLDRIARETKAAVTERDPAKLAAAGGFVVLAGTTALIQGLRHVIYGTPEGEPAETPLHYALETLDRTGLFGAASPLINAFEGLRFKRSVGNVLLGSVAGRGVQALDAVGGLVTQNSDNTNTAERRAAAAVYDMAIRPAENAIGAGVLRGGLGSAVILGTGGKKNGVVANDKDAFQTMLAGPEEERDDPDPDDDADE